MIYFFFFLLSFLCKRIESHLKYRSNRKSHGYQSSRRSTLSLPNKCHRPLVMISSVEEIINARDKHNTTKHDNTPVEGLHSGVRSTWPSGPEKDKDAIQKCDCVDRDTPFTQRP